MNNVTIEALAWALVHFLWQGAAIALLAGLVGAALGHARPNARYVVMCCAMASMLIAPSITFLTLNHPPSAPAAPSVAIAIASPAHAAVPAPAMPAPADSTWISWLVGIWLAGVVIVGARSLGGWILAQRLMRRGTAPAAESLQRTAAALRARLGIRRAVRVLSSAVAEVPATIGWLRPVVLLPVSAFTALSAEQLELVLAHELAHVRRYDYLVNLAQTAVETLLFYHPAVWWVSRHIRAEREHCCDDLAVASCGNVIAYARALATLEGLRTAPSALVLAADGGSLLSRIQRLLNGARGQRNTPPSWVSALLPAALVLATVVSAAPPKAAPVTSPPPRGEATGFLGGLTEAGYVNLSVDEIIALREHGVEPHYVKGMLAAGLGVPAVEEMIRLHDHAVEPEFVAGIVRAGLVSDLTLDNVIRLRENGVDVDDLAAIRGLGFGPYSVSDTIKLGQNGVDVSTFATLKEIGLERPSVSDAVEARQNGLTVERIRDMRRQGFGNLNLQQIIKLCRGGII